MIVSNYTVINPFIIANIIIAKTGNGILDSWKNKIVPKSPIEQPNKHHAVFFTRALCAFTRPVKCSGFHANMIIFSNDF